MDIIDKCARQGHKLIVIINKEDIIPEEYVREELLKKVVKNKIEKK